MLAATLRSSMANSARRSAASSVNLSTPAASSRSMLTVAEKWTQKDVQEALTSPDAKKVVLKDIVPNIEARWKGMSKVEQYTLYRQLEELQRKDWKELSLDEKKAAYWVSFGPHGPRKPVTEPGQAARTALGVSACLAVSLGLFILMRYNAAPPPKTMTKEYQEQMTEKAREEKLNPITGISSEGYKGKGYVQ